MTSILEDFGLPLEIDSGVLHTIWGDDATNPDVLKSPAASLRKWLTLLPQSVAQQVDLALGQERPFMPPDMTPEMMAEPNTTVPSMNHMEIICRCIDFAMQAGDYSMAAALVYVVDRTCYRFGRSAALLRVVEEILRVSHDTAIAPQVILRQARVMKDSGDLHTALRVLDAVISGERKWDYKNREQYENTKAVCVQIKGQILHNLGLWKEAIPPLVQSVTAFQVVNDDKGTASSLVLLSRCLKKLAVQDYGELQGQFLDMFPTAHPYYEAYQKALKAVCLIEDLGATVYVANSQLTADESLLMFTILQADMPERQKLDQYQVIVREMKRSLASHRTVHHLHSLEVYQIFVRAVFMISLTLGFSPVPEDTDLARFLEKLSLELYGYMCQQLSGGGSGEPLASLNQSQYSVRLMNTALALLGLPALAGSADMEQREPEKKWSEVEKSEAKEATTEGEKESHSSNSSSNLFLSQPTESSVPSSQSESSGAEGDMVNSQSEPRVILTSKAMTFPAATPSKFRQGERHTLADHQLRQKFVGLIMSRDDLLAATCPALAADTVGFGGDAEAVETSKDQVDVDSLIVSADSITAASISREASSSTPQYSATVDRSATTRSTSSATTHSSAAEDLKTKSSGSSTVDRSATTKSTSSATTESSAEISSSNSSGPPGSSPAPSSATVDRVADTEQSSTSKTTDPGDGEVLSPLLDVSSACELMSSLELGDSIETNDSSQFLAHFTPSDNKDIHRAVVMTYNPVAGHWSAQSTLAYLGPLLNLETKGANRDAFHVSFLHQDEPLGKYVGKRYRRGRKAPEVYMQDVVCQMLAGFYVTRFNQALQHCPDDILQVQFLSAAHLQLLNKDGKVFDWINVEPFLHGSFLKLTNNLRFVSKAQKDERGVEVATALSHFSYAETGGKLMMVDLQGWIPKDGKGVVYLTDPVFHTLNMKEFSSGDRHQEGMRAFWANQHPKCNRICQYLGLDKSRPDAASV